MTNKPNAPSRATKASAKKAVPGSSTRKPAKAAAITEDAPKPTAATKPKPATTTSVANSKDTKSKAPRRILRAMLEIATPASIRWQLGTDDVDGVFTAMEGHTWVFSISREKLHACESSIKTALERFATLYVDDHNEEKLIDALELVVEKGQELADTLMTGFDPDDEVRASVFRKFFNEKIARVNQATSDPDVTIELVTTKDIGHTIMTPVGLAFTRREKRKRPARLDYESYQDFWSNSFRASSFMHNHNKKMPPEPASGADFDIVIVREDQDNEPYMIIHKNLSLKDRKGGVSFTKGEKVATATSAIGSKIAATHAQRCVLFYFDLEATDRSRGSDRHKTASMRLKAGDDVEYATPADFRHEYQFALNAAPSLAVPKSGKPTYAVAVVDREAIIRGDRGAEWIQEFMDKPWNGVIAVECDVRSQSKPWKQDKEVPYDRLMGLLFMRSILTQTAERMVNALVVARRDCWPYSLFYGVYCNPRQPWIDDTRPTLVEEIERLIPHFGDGHPGNRHAAVRGEGS